MTRDKRFTIVIRKFNVSRYKNEKNESSITLLKVPSFRTFIENLKIARVFTNGTSVQGYYRIVASARSGVLRHHQHFNDQEHEQCH